MSGGWIPQLESYIVTMLPSWYYNYLPVPDAEYKSAWWCHYNDTGATPWGQDRCPAGAVSAM